MKILHTSDIHLASPLTTRLSADKVRERKRELLQSFRRMVEDARAVGAEGFIIAGDLFDSERVSVTAVENLLGIIEMAPEITFFYLYGNHEGGLLEKSGGELPKNLKLFGKEWTVFTLGEVNLIGRCDTEKDMFKGMQLPVEGRNILVLHGELRDRSEAGGIIGTSELEGLKVDYLALGHYHSYSAIQLTDKITAVYPGTPEGRGFDECGEKGYVMISTTPYGIEHNFVGSAKRRLRIVEVDLSGLARTVDIEDAVKKELRDIPSRDMVRAVLVGTHEPGQRLDAAAIASAFVNKYYYFEVKDKTRTRISKDDYINDKSLKGEFIRGVLADEKLTDEEKERVIDMGLAALMNEEI